MIIFFFKLGFLRRPTLHTNVVRYENENQQQKFYVMCVVYTETDKNEKQL